MLIVNMFLRYADLLTCHFERFSILVLQCDCLVLSKRHLLIVIVLQPYETDLAIFQFTYGAKNSKTKPRICLPIMITAS